MPWLPHVEGVDIGIGLIRLFQLLWNCSMLRVVNRGVLHFGCCCLFSQTADWRTIVRPWFGLLATTRRGACLDRFQARCLRILFFSFGTSALVVWGLLILSLSFCILLLVCFMSYL